MLPTLSDWGQVSDSVRCMICNNIYTNPVAVTPCGHIFCRECIANTIENGTTPQDNENKPPNGKKKRKRIKNVCPQCFGPAFLWSLSRIYLIERIVQSVLQFEENKALQAFDRVQSLPGNDISTITPSVDIPLGQKENGTNRIPGDEQGSRFSQSAPHGLHPIENYVGMNFSHKTRPCTENTEHMESASENNSRSEYSPDESIRELVTIIKEQNSLLSNIRKQLNLLGKLQSN